MTLSQIVFRIIKSQGVDYYSEQNFNFVAYCSYQKEKLALTQNWLSKHPTHQKVNDKLAAVLNLSQLGPLKEKAGAFLKTKRKISYKKCIR